MSMQDEVDGNIERRRMTDKSNFEPTKKPFWARFLWWYSDRKKIVKEDVKVPILNLPEEVKHEPEEGSKQESDENEMISFEGINKEMSASGNFPVFIEFIIPHMNYNLL